MKGHSAKKCLQSSYSAPQREHSSLNEGITNWSLTRVRIELEIIFKGAIYALGGEGISRDESRLAEMENV